MGEINYIYMGLCNAFTQLVRFIMFLNKINLLPKFRAYFPVMNAALEGESMGDT